MQVHFAAPNRYLYYNRAGAVIVVKILSLFCKFYKTLPLSGSWISTQDRAVNVWKTFPVFQMLTKRIKDVTIWLHFFQGSVCMAETKTEGLIYKGHPLRRIDNLIY